MICNNCGSRNNDYDSICVNCGAALSDERSKNNHSKKKIIGIAVSCICIVAMMIAAILIVSNVTSTKDLEEAIATKDAYNVNYVYSQAYDKESKLKKYDKIIGNTISEIKDDINNHNFENEALEYGKDAVWNYCTSSWGTLVFSEESVNIASSISSDNFDSWTELNNLLESKSNYCDGLYYKADNEYDDAIECFSLVMEQDSNYEDAKAKSDECFEEYANAVLKDVDEKISAGDISGAVLMLKTEKEHMKELGLNSEEIEKRLDSVLLEYAKSYADKAEAEFKKHDVNAAIGNIEAAMELVPDNADFKTKYNTYKQYLPFALYSKENIISFTPGEGSFSYKEDMRANDNTVMKDVLFIDSYVNKDFWHSDASDLATTIIYNLNGKYDVVTGRIFLSQEKKNQAFPSYFEAYGDGKLIYTSPKMKSGELPKRVEINVSDIQKLELRFYVEIAELNYVSGEFGISDFIAQKNFPE